MSKIRLGLLRCDIHGYWYGPFLGPCDARLLEKYAHEVHHLFSTLFDPAKLHVGTVSGFELTKVWDAEPQRAEEFAATFLGKPVVCRTIEEMTEGIDAVFIADCSGDGHDHAKLAAPFLKKGIPAFVDKPFATNLKDARKIVNLAKKGGTCVMSASLLEHNPNAKLFRRRFDEIGPVRLVVAKGVGGYGLAGAIHGLGLVRGLLGDGVEWVEAVGHTELDPSATRELNQGDFAEWTGGKGHVPLTYLHLHYKTGTEALVLNTSGDIFPERCNFYASAYSRQGAIHSPAIGDPEFLPGGETIVKLFRKMVRTGKPVIPYESLLEKIAILDAGRLAQKEGRPVHLKEVM